MVFGDSLIGKQLANYRIEQLLGHGGMARVYLGWDVRLHRPVAVKVIDERIREDASYSDRFLREARTMATWNHPNIPQVYHAGEEEGVVFFAMEYIRGQNLAQLLRQVPDSGETLPYVDVLRVGQAIAAALDFAHRKGVIHRDVTPANVILAEDGRVVLTDFGLALDVIEGTRGEVFGTPHYMSPEQARSSSRAVPQSDLYSLGVILYEMLTGAVPFDDGSPASLALKHITDEPPRPSLINPRIGPEVEAVLLKALSKTPGERYQSGKALMEALERALHRQEIKNQPATLAELPGGYGGFPPETAAEIPAARETAPVSVPPARPPQASGSSVSGSSVSGSMTSGSLTGGVPTSGPAERRAPRPGTERSGFQFLGGLGCGLALLAAFALLVAAASLALSNQNSPSQSPPAPTQLLAGEIEETQNAAATATAAALLSTSPAPSREPTSTPTRTLAASPTITITPTPTPVPYRIMLVSFKDESLFVINLGARPFPLPLLELKNEEGEVSGEEWEVDFLEQEECAAVWKEEGRPRFPQDLECELVGKRLERKGQEKFWTEEFDVYFMGEKIAECDTTERECRIQLPGE
jgi:serine/threonine protein kinase